MKGGVSMPKRKPKKDTPETWICHACGKESTTPSYCSECGVLLNG